jgi:hypothetical protein
VKRLALALAVTVAALAVPAGVAVAASPTLRTALVHTLRGCHEWSIAGKARGPSASVVVAHGTRIAIRISCPMEFELTQVRGPVLALGASTFQPGTTRYVAFRKPGTYKLRARNLQTPEEVGLQTLGPDNAPTLTIVAR